MIVRFLLLVLCNATLSCGFNNSNHKPSTISGDTTTFTPDKDTTEAFNDFNQRFHSDSAFQRSRIVFPIGGRHVDGWESHPWTAQNWVILKEPVKDSIYTSDYKHSISRTKETVTEKYWIDSGGFLFERHFKLHGGRWYLTYCNDINL